MISERIARLSDKVRNTPPTICIDRARLVTDFYKRPSMEPFILQRAKAFKHVLENKEIFIDDDSILAGHMASRMHAVPVFPEMSAWLREDLETLDTRKYDNFQFLSGEKDELRKIVADWEGGTFGDLTNAQITEEEWDLLKIGVFTKGISQLSTMNIAPDYDEMVKKGYRYYIDQCKEQLAALDDMDIETMGKKITWEAMIITMEAIISFAHRYADLAEKLAIESTDVKRKEQLSAIATNCRVVPENAPETFEQAAQLVWFTHLAFMMENNGSDHSLGRFDQYMYDFYKKDLERGISKEFIADVIHEFKLKFEEMWYLRNEFESEAYPGCALYIHIMLGGMLADGSDGCNELTELVLLCMEDLQTKEPCVSFRYHDNINQDTFRLAMRVALQGGSHPAFFNDETCISYLTRLGFTKEDAVNWAVCGCTETVSQGKSDFQSQMGYYNAIKVFEIALYDGMDPVSKKQIGPHTGDIKSFTSIEQLKDAYLKQQEFFLRKFIVLFNKMVSCHAYAVPTLTGSCFTDGCIRNGRVLQQKGCDNRWSAIAVTGLANIADSFAAIEECVFNKNYLSMAELVNLLDTDFEGKEEMRQLLINRAPKFGNDIEAVDKYAHFVVKTLDDEGKKYKDGRGGELTTVWATQSYNVVLGRMIGATPDGRHAFSTMADNVSPMIGMDVNGPTAVVNSVNAVDSTIPQSGLLLNQRFDPAIVKGEKGIDILEAVLRAHFKKDGDHLQINVVDDETLRAAQKEPEKFRNMLVRVAGYSAFFVDLEKNIQDNIIQRTVQRTV
ncbi:MAG: glycyl radical protein [Suipraeoptans sp.]